MSQHLDPLELPKKVKRFCSCPRSRKTVNRPNGRPDHQPGCHRFKSAKCHPSRHAFYSGLCWDCNHSEWIKNWRKTPEGRASTLEGARKYRLRTRYGITEEIYLELLAKQDHVCAICQQSCASGRRLAVDHDHATGCVRGLLCRRCNQLLGRMEDSPLLLERAAAYLRKNASDQ